MKYVEVEFGIDKNNLFFMVILVRFEYKIEC